MCHGHPRHHPCAHTSIIWHYCPAALFNLDTGYEEPCKNRSYASSQPTNGDCPLQNCQFKAMGGSWTCCACNQGPNTQGWCTKTVTRRGHLNGEMPGYGDREETCDHGCCKKCTRSGPSRSSSPDMTFSELRKGNQSRKQSSSSRGSHRHGSTFSLIGAFPPVREEGEFSSSSSASSSKSSSSGSPPGCQVGLDYARKKSKSSAKGHRKVKVH